MILEQVVSKTLIDELLEDIEYLKRHRQCFDLSVEIKGGHVPISECAVEELDKEGTKLNSLIAVSRAAARLSLTREVSVFLRHVLGEPPCALQSLTYNRGTQQPVHIDYPYVRCQTRLSHLAASWIPLEDISPASGPLAYYTGSHRVEISGFFDWGGGSILMEPDSRRTPMEFSEYMCGTK